MRSNYLGALLTFSVLLAGCGKGPPPAIVPAEGQVFLEGEPLTKALVRFIPMTDHGAEFIATAVTDDNGRFELTCNGKPGACAVENKILVSDSEIPAKLLGENAQKELAEYLSKLKNRPIPEKYGNLVTSPLAEIVSEGKKKYTIHLTRN